MRRGVRKVKANGGLAHRQREPAARGPVTQFARLSFIVLNVSKLDAEGCHCGYGSLCLFGLMTY